MPRASSAPNLKLSEPPVALPPHPRNAAPPFSMAADDSDTSSLSSAASDKEIAKLAPIFTKSKAATKIRCPPPYVSPPRPKRPPSPPHEEVFADTSDIPVSASKQWTRESALVTRLRHVQFH